MPRSRQVEWWHRWAMPGILAAADSLRPGLGWCLGNSTGGKAKLLGISKRGDCYLRTLLIHGARSVIAAAGRRKQSTVGQPAVQQRAARWLEALISRRNRNIAAVALANKNASSGHCWRTEIAIKLSTLWLRRDAPSKDEEDRKEDLKFSSDERISRREAVNATSSPRTCPGDHDVMAQRSRPWLAKP